MGENNDDIDPFEEDIVFDQTGLLGRKTSRPPLHQPPSGSLPTFLLFIRVVFLCVIFVGLGLCVAVSQGPLVNLEVTFGISAHKAFHVFTAYSLGMLLGGLLGSTLFEVYNRQFLIFISLLWVSSCIIVLPFTIAVSYWWTIITISALGSGLAFIFTGSNVLILDLLGKQRGSGMQCLHFCFAIGALIAALSIRPFLSGISSLGLGPGNSSLGSVDASPNPLELQRVPRGIELGLFENETQTTLPPVVDINSLAYSTKSLPINSTIKNVTLVHSTLISESINTTPSSRVTIDDPHEEMESLPKPPKPKPSFTNANLIPEPSKWERPSQNEISSVPIDNHTENANSVSTEKEILVSTDDVLTTSSPLTSNLTLMKQNANKIQNETSDVETTTQVTTTVTIIVNATDHNASTHMGDASAALEMSSKYSEFMTGNINDDTPLNSTKLSYHSTTHKSTTTTQPTTIVTASSTTNVPSTKNTDSGSSNDMVNVSYNLKPTDSPIAVSKVSSSVPHPILVQPLTRKPKAQQVSNPPQYTPVPKQILAGTTQDSFKIDYPPTFPDDYDGNIDDFDYSFNYNQGMPFGSIANQNSDSEPHLLDLKEPLMSDDTKSLAPQLPEGQTKELPIHQNKPGTFSNFSEMNPHFLDTLAANFKNYGITGIHLFYIGIGIAIMILGLISVIFLCHKPREPRSKQEDGCLTKVHKTQLHIFVLLFSLYMFSAEALQGAIHHLLAASHTTDGFPLFTKSVDGQVVFWGLVSGVRFLCTLIFGCARIKPGKLLVISNFMMVLGTILFCIGTYNKKDFLWGGIIVVAIGLAPVLPTCFLWMAEYMKVTHRMCALMIVLSSFGNSLTHTTLTYIVVNSHLYSYILISISLFSVLFLTTTFCILFKNIKNKSLALPQGYHLASQDDEEGLELSRQHLRNYDHLSHHVNEMSEAGQALLID